jgi:hypothetical protein
MHIFKKSVSGLDTDEGGNDTAATPPYLSAGAAPVLPPPASDATQQHLQDLQRQVEELQRQSAGGARSEDQTAQPR